VILDHVNDEMAFRATIQAWLAKVLPECPKPAPGQSHDSMYEPISRWWMGEMNKQNLGTPHWPKEYGGVDLTVRHQAILAEEFARADAPSLGMFQISLNHIPATLMAWGSEYQKRKYLPGVSNGVVWCQGFSEPGAGSDLASLRTRAENRGDHYLINGQKIWSSYSMYASQAILLARTDPTAAKHAGISFFLMDMKAPGVEVRPIRQLNGKSKFTELFLADVKIPIEDRIGEEGQGWSVAQTTLSAERGLLSFEAAERMRYAMEKFQRESLAQGLAWTQEPELTRKFMRLFGRIQAIRSLMRDMLFAEHADNSGAAIKSAGIKVLFSTLRRDFGEFMSEALGSAAVLEDGTGDDLAGGSQYVYLSAFSLMIGGGTNEIMRNIISERGLGMPKG
jgi:alkylation response protein AidB-like acyl-CoA dehydrogenase